MIASMLCVKTDRKGAAALLDLAESYPESITAAKYSPPVEVSIAKSTYAYYNLLVCLDDS